MPYRISRLGLVEIRSVDLDRDLDYYLNVLGLQLTGREGRTAYQKGWDERHAYSLASTRTASRSPPGCGSDPRPMTSPSSPAEPEGFTTPRSSWTPQRRCFARRTS